MYKEKIKITSVDVDSNLNLRVPSIFKFFQQVSSNHSEKLGVGKSNTIDKNMCWIITRFKVEIYDYPKLNDEIIVSTHPGETNKFLFPRHYQIYDHKGNLLVSGCAIWLVLNQETRRIVTKPFGDNEFKAEHSKDDISLPTAIDVNDKLEEYEKRKVRYNDTDLNGHLNNTKYIDYILDVRDRGFYNNHLLKEIIISYEKEIKENQVVTISRNSDELNQFVRGTIDGNNSFTAHLIYKKVEEKL